MPAEHLLRSIDRFVELDGVRPELAPPKWGDRVPQGAVRIKCEALLLTHLRAGCLADRGQRAYDRALAAVGTPGCEIISRSP